ncbi:MAG: 16S rRNA (guanine(966)-N(2))-methyltransferase RsmD, partial [Chlamydiota bacterium]
MSFLRIIGGLFKSRQIKAPKTSFVRPTSSSLRESVFNICQNRIEGANFLDLFGGSGAMGLEALSRKAAHVTFVDNSKEAVSVIEENIRALGVQDFTKVFLGDVFTILKRLGKSGTVFDIVYIDPPYRLYEDRTFVFRLLTSLQEYKIIREG